MSKNITGYEKKGPVFEMKTNLSLVLIQDKTYPSSFEYFTSNTEIATYKILFFQDNKSAT